MSLPIALNPELEAKLLAEAKQPGQSLDTFLQQRKGPGVNPSGAI